MSDGVPAPDDAPGSRGQFRRREEVLETAARLFFESGYAATSTTDLARALGMHRGSIYYYLSTKEELLYELIQRRFASGTELLGKLGEREGTALDKLAWLIEAHIGAIGANVIPSALALNEARSLSPDHRAQIAADDAAYQQGVTALIEEGQRDGSIRADVSPKLAALAVLGAANWMHRWFDERRGASVADVGRQFAAILTRGLSTTGTINDLLERLEQQTLRIAELEALVDRDSVGPVTQAPHPAASRPGTRGLPQASPAVPAAHELADR